MKIGIFGGTFNPVHDEHINICKNAIKELGLDKLIIVPTFLPPHKEVISVGEKDRVNMLKIAFADIENAVISDFEFQNKGTSYSFITLEHFKNIYKGDALFFIIGGDSLVSFKTWRNPERILDCATLAVADREGLDADYNKEREYFNKTFGKDFILLSYKGKDFSSTRVRVYSSLSLPLDGVIREDIANYIKENGLYKGDKYTEYVKSKLPEKRLFHTAEVMITALSKANELNLNAEKVRLSALLHDVAKYMDYKKVKGFRIDDDMVAPVVHAFLGAYIVKNILDIDDEEIIDAIKYHTSGKANMSLLGKLIFVADMIEKNRDYEGVEKLRELYKRDFNLAFKTCLYEEMQHLLNKKSRIYIETLNAYDYYINEKKD